jgi:hypothetical protein
MLSVVILNVVVPTNRPKLPSLSLASIVSLVLCFWLRLEACTIKHYRLIIYGKWVDFFLS